LAVLKFCFLSGFGGLRLAFVSGAPLTVTLGSLGSGVSAFRLWGLSAAGGFQAVGCRCWVSLRVGLSVISESCGLLALPFPFMFRVLRSGVWAVSCGCGCVVRHRWRCRFLGFWRFVWLGFLVEFKLGFCLAVALFGFSPSLSACRVWVLRRHSQAGEVGF